MRAVYKCRLCGEKYFQGMTGETVALARTSSLTVNEITDSLLGRYSIHKCKDGSVGFSDFLGFEMEVVRNGASNNTDNGQNSD